MTPGEGDEKSAPSRGSDFHGLEGLDSSFSLEEWKSPSLESQSPDCGYPNSRNGRRMG